MVARVRSHMNEVSQVDRFLFSKIHFLVRDDKHVIVQVFARFGKMSGLVWSRHGYFKNTNHGSTKLALIFSRIGEKPARLHIIIFLFQIYSSYLLSNFVSFSKLWLPFPQRKPCWAKLFAIFSLFFFSPFLLL